MVSEDSIQAISTCSMKVGMEDALQCHLNSDSKIEDWVQRHWEHDSFRRGETE